WKRNDFRVPALRGRGGILRDLIGKGIIDESLAEEIGRVYGQLSGAIHGSQRDLIYSRAHLNEPDGLVFRTARYREWCGWFAKAVELGIRTHRAGVLYWCSDVNRPFECQICHGKDFMVIPHEVNVRVKALIGDLWSVTCRLCGNKVSSTDDYWR